MSATNEMESIKNILGVWRDVQYFTNEFPKKPDSFILSSDNMEKSLPWENEGQGEYEVYLGEVSLEEVVGELNEILDIKGMSEKVTGKMCIGGFVVDSQGRYIDKSFKITPFFFGISEVLKRKTSIDITKKQMIIFNDEMNAVILNNFTGPVTAQVIKEILEMICHNSRYVYKGKLIGIINKGEKKCLEKGNSTKLEILKSFYVQDIGQILMDILCDENKLRGWLRVEQYPMGKWPSKDPLNLAQQVVVNVGIAQKDKAEKVFSVNELSATGKNTLIKEIIASIVVERAYLLISKEPDNLFQKRKLMLDNQGEEEFVAYYEVPNELKSYGIFIVSNSTAAQSIPTDLLREIHESLTGLFNGKGQDEIYFTDIASALMEGDEKAWGLIAAKMGEREDIGNFNKFLTPDDPNTLLGAHYANNKLSWHEARAEFLHTWEEVQEYREQIAEDVKIVENIIRFKEEEAEFKQRIEKIKLAIVDHDETIKRLRDRCQEINELIDIKRMTKMDLDKKAEQQKTDMPVGQQILYKMGLGKSAQDLKELAFQFEVIEEEETKLLEEYDELQEQIKVVVTKKESQCNRIKNLEMKLEKLLNKINSIDNIKNKYQKGYADYAFYEMATNVNQAELPAPWLTEEYDKLREKLFYDALMVHKALVLSSESIKQNIRLMYGWWTEERFNEQQKKLIYPSLLATIQLITPIEFITFAAILASLKYVGKQGMGMLIVDEEMLKKLFDRMDIYVQ